MRLRRNTLNNLMMDNQRKNPLYQTLITDLAITGNISREDAEMLLGYKIPEFLKTPDGESLAAEPVEDEESDDEESDGEDEESDDEESDGEDEEKK